ncbi:MAG: tetratricopeptide repeat protein [Planctomycetaceae bacterium]|nr:tetratricopeptide repeat protein [Planctomycetaceae bacterium]
MIQTVRSVGSDTPEGVGSETRAGSILGTPAYLPPEQALGHVDEMNERSDVFGLGAILCVILTGEPPYVAETGAQVYRMAQKAKLDDCFARLDSCYADNDLIALAKDCLQPEQKQRPHDAGEVSQRISSYLESVEAKLRETEVERAAEAARAVESRKRLRVTLALAASVMLLFSVVGGGWVWTEQRAVERREFLTSKVNAALNEAIVQQGRAETEELRDQLLHLELASASAKQAVELVEQDDVDSTLASRARQLLADLSKQSTQVEQLADKAKKDNAFQAELELIRLSQSDGLAASVTLNTSSPGQHESMELEVSPAQQESEPGLPAPIRPDEALSSAALPSELDTTLSISNIDTSIEQYERVFREAGIDLQQLSITEAAALIQKSAIRETLIAAVDNWARARARKSSADEATSTITHAKLLAIAAAADDSEWRKTVRTALDAGDTEQLKQLANSDESRSRSPELIAWLGAALREGKETATSIEVLKQSLKKHPDDFWLNYELAKSLSQNKHHLEGLGYARAAMVIRPNSLGSLMALAVIYAESGNHDDAVDFYQQVLEQRPDLLEAQSGMALAYMAQNKWEGAIAACRKALELVPSNGELRGILALALRETGRNQEAWFQAREAVQRDRGNPLAHFYLGRVMEARWPGVAESAYEETVRLDPDNSQAYYRLGIIRFHSDPAGAVDALTSAVSLDSANGEAYTWLGHVLFNLGRNEESLRAFETAIVCSPNLSWPRYHITMPLVALGRSEDAIASAHRGVELDSTNFKAHTRLGNAYARHGDLADAVQSYRRAFELVPNDVWAVDSLYRALLTTDRSRPADIWMKLLTWEPDCSIAADKLVSLLQQNAVDGIIDLSSLLELPEKSLLTVGKSLHSERLYDAAILVFSTVTERDPQCADAFEWLGSSLRTKGDYEKSIAPLTRALELDPQKTWIYTQIAWTRSAQNNFSAAENAYHEAVDRNPHKSDPCRGLAWILRGQRRLDEAVLWYQRAMEIDPFHADGFLGLGAVREQQGQVAEAEHLYRQWIEVDPVNANAYQHLHGLLRKQGREDDALESFATMLDGAVNNVEKEMIYGLLRGMGVADKVAARRPDDSTLRRFHARQTLDQLAVTSTTNPQADQKATLEVVTAALKQFPNDLTLAAAGANALLKIAQEKTEWTALLPDRLISEGGAHLELQPDASVLASGRNPDRDQYVVSVGFDTEMTIAAIRLEALVHRSLPRGGPGRDSLRNDGSFSMYQFHLAMQNTDGSTTPISIRHAEADYWSWWVPVTPSVWNIAGSVGKSHSAVYELPTPLTVTPGSRLEFRMSFSPDEDWPGQNLGCFRLSTSMDPQAFQSDSATFAATRIADPWGRLTAAYELAGQNQLAKETLVDHPEASKTLLKWYAFKEQWQQVVDICNQLISQETDDTTLLMTRAGAYMELEQLDVARADWKRAHELDAELVTTTLKTAFETASQAEHWQEAVRYGWQWLELKPVDEFRWMQVATALARSGNASEYSAFCERAATQYAGTEIGGTSERVTKMTLLLPGAIDPARLPSQPLTKYLDQAAGAKGGHLPWFWSTRALLAYRTGDSASAIRYVARAEEHKPVDVTRAMALSILALAQHRVGKIDEATAMLQQATELAAAIRQQTLAKGSNVADVQIAEVLLREATQVIGATGKPVADEAE